MPLALALFYSTYLPHGSYAIIICNPPHEVVIMWQNLYYILHKHFTSAHVLRDRIRCYNRCKGQEYSDFKNDWLPKYLQGVYTKYSCFLCLWDSHVTSRHYIPQKALASKRTLYSRHTKCEVYQSLVESEKVLMPLLHIKQFVKALNTESEALKYLSNMF